MTLLANELSAITSDRIRRSRINDDEMTRALEIQNQIASLAAELDDILASE